MVGSRRSSRAMDGETLPATARQWAAVAWGHALVNSATYRALSASFGANEIQCSGHCSCNLSIARNLGCKWTRSSGITLN